jgi:hypothetical protein
VRERGITAVISVMSMISVISGFDCRGCGGGERFVNLRVL